MKTNRNALFGLFATLLIILSVSIFATIKMQEIASKLPLSMELEAMTQPNESIGVCNYVEYSMENYIIKTNNKYLQIPIESTKIEKGEENKLLIIGKDKDVFKLISYFNTQNLSDKDLNQLINNLDVTLILSSYDCIQNLRNSERHIFPISEFKTISTKIYNTGIKQAFIEQRDCSSKNSNTKFQLYNNRWSKYLCSTRNQYKSVREYNYSRRIYGYLQKTISHKTANKKT